MKVSGATSSPNRCSHGTVPKIAAATRFTTSVGVAPGPADRPRTTKLAHTTTPMTEEERRKLAQEQLKKQEKQRVFAVMAAFNTTANKDAVPLSAGEKYQLFFKSASDPWPFVLTAFGAGIDQAVSGAVQIGTSDSYMSDADIRHHPQILNIPMAISAQTVNYNLPGLNSTNVKLDGPTLAGIYTGKIRTWDDKAIAGLNPGVALPAAMMPLLVTDPVTLP